MVVFGSNCINYNDHKERGGVLNIVGSTEEAVQKKNCEQDKFFLLVIVKIVIVSHN